MSLDPANPINPTLAYLMSDVARSTELWQRDSERMAREVVRLDGVCEAAFAQRCGELVKSRGEGDSHFGVFRRAQDAVRAAIQVQSATLSDPELKDIRLRMGIHLGSAEQWAGDHYGPVINRCARIRQVAHPGQILVSEAVYAVLAGDGEMAFKDLGTHRLRDLLQPERLYQVLHPGLPSDFSPLETLSTRSHNLPGYLTSFVGRERELEDLAEMVDRNRLLTLTGPGGIGKTRLTQQLAADLIDRFQDGVWFIDLAQTDRDESVVPILCGELKCGGDASEQALFETINAQRMLVILDNCEHLFEACRSLASHLLQRCPQLRLLATSRRLLDVRGEYVYRLDGLPLPPDGASDPMSFAGFALFVERARQRGVELPLDEATATEITLLCRKLDGLPLALEMAAGLTDVLGISEIADSIGEIDGNGGDPRQRTIAATIDWSRRMLSSEGRRLLDLVSVFPNTWTLDAAAEVCLPTQSKLYVRNLLRELLNHSLVFSTLAAGGGKRFGLLQTTREVVLDGSPPHDDLVPAFVSFFERLVTSTKVMADQGDEGAAHAIVSLEWESISQAMNLAYVTDPNRTARMALALRGFWMSGTRLAEGKRWYRELARNGELEPSLRVSALIALSSVCILLGENDEAQTALLEAEEIVRPIGGYELARVIGNLAVHQDRMGLFREAKAGFEACYQLFKACGAHREQALSLLNLGVAKLRLDEPSEASAECYRRALKIAQEREFIPYQAKAFSCLAHLELRAGQWVESLRLNHRALRLWQQDLVIPDCALVMLDLAEAFIGLERFEWAASAVHLADRFEELSDSPFPSVQRGRLEASRATTRSRIPIGEWRAGQRLLKTKSASESTALAIQLIESAV